MSANLFIFDELLLPSPIRSHHFLSPAILIRVSSTVSVLILHLKQPVPSLYLLFTLNLTTVTLSLYYNLPQKSRINHLQYCLALLVLFSCILFCLLLLGCL